MTAREWLIVRRIASLVLIVAIFPLAALTYKLYLSPEVGAELLPSPTPMLYTLVPGPTGTVVPSPTPTSAYLVLPNGWTDYQLVDEHFAIALPGSWQRLPVNRQDLDAVLEVMRQGNPELAAALSARSQQLSSGEVRFWAFDPDPDSLQHRLATNITITRQTVPNAVSNDAYVLVNVNQINSLTSRSGQVTHERVELGNVSAEQVDYGLTLAASDGTTVLSAITQYLVLDYNTSYVLTFATRVDELDHYRSTFEQSAKTFRIFGQ